MNLSMTIRGSWMPQSLFSEQSKTCGINWGVEGWPDSETLSGHLLADNMGLGLSTQWTAGGLAKLQPEPEESQS